MDRAFALLEEAVQKCNCWLAVPRMPLFDAFRADPDSTSTLSDWATPTDL